MDVGARLEQDFERFADLFVGLVAAAGRVVGVPHAARIISGVTWYALGSSTKRDVLNRITNGSSRPAIRPRPHQGRQALKRSVALTLVLLSGAAWPRPPCRCATSVNAASTSAWAESGSAPVLPDSTAPDGGAGAIL